MTERLLTLIEVSDLLRVSPHTIRAWVRKGRLRPVRICRRLLFDPAEVSREDRGRHGSCIGGTVIMPATMGQDEATEVMLVLQEVLRDHEFARTLVALVFINSPNTTESDRSELQRMSARWNYGRRH